MHGGKHREGEKNKKKRWIRCIPGKLPQVCTAQRWVVDGECMRRVGQGDVNRGQGRGGQMEERKKDERLTRQRDEQNDCTSTGN